MTGIKRTIKGGAAKAKQVAGQARKGLDQTLLDIRSKAKSIEFDKDLIQKIGQRVLAKAKEIRKSLNADELVKTSQAKKDQFTQDVMVRARSTKNKFSKISVKKAVKKVVRKSPKKSAKKSKTSASRSASKKNLDPMVGL